MKVTAAKNIEGADPQNYSNVYIIKGTRMTVFRGPTYGCIGDGVALTFSDDPFEGCFFELPRDYVSVDGEDSF